MCNSNCSRVDPCVCCKSHNYGLKVELGKTYLNGAGNKVRIICVNGRTEVCGDSSLPVIGLVELPSGNERVETYTLDGYYNNLKGRLDANLVKEYKEPEYRWMNRYINGFGGYFKTAEEAKKVAKHEINYGLYKINLDTGEVTQERL